MNYDMNDGIPPYDMNFDDSSNAGKPVSDDAPENDYRLSSDFGDGLSKSSDGAEQIPLEELNIGQFVDGVQSEDYHAYQEPPVQGPSNKPMNLMPIIILLMLLILGGSLVLIYGSEVIPNFSLDLGKKSDTAQEDIQSQNLENEDLANVPELPDVGGSNESDDVFQDADINVMRNNRSADIVSGRDSVNDSLGLPSESGANKKYSRDDLLSTAKNSSLQNPPRTIGRLDPFNPNSGSDQLFDVLMPPSNPTPDLEAQMLLSLTITGIMYSSDSPSAIISIGGTEQLVRIGDKFDGFNVVGITKDKVTVRAGKNVYTASVGETVDVESAGVRPIPNLNRKFAGPYSKGSGRIIEINTIN